MTALNIFGIQNCYKVDDIVWRGAQPDDTAWPLLAAAGCRTVIDLNNARDAVIRQDTLIAPTGMRYWALDWSGILPPSLERVQEAIERIDDSIRFAAAPVFIHCQHGSDRTGTLCACWRMHHDGYSFEQAMKEAFTDLGLQGLHEFWMAEAAARYAHATGKCR